MKIYLDTSVYGGYYDKGQEDSKELLKAIKKLKITVMYSAVLDSEFENAPPHILSRLTKVFTSIEKRKLLKTSVESENLAKEYIALGVLTAKSLNDARHIALATLNKVDYIVSWNFNHMTKRDKKYERANKLLNFKHVKIVSPTKFLTEILKWRKNK